MGLFDFFANVGDKLMNKGFNISVRIPFGPGKTPDSPTSLLWRWITNKEDKDQDKK